MYTITVPYNDKNALRAAAEFFARMCDCIVEPRPRVGGLVTGIHGDTSELKAALEETKKKLDALRPETALKAFGETVTDTMRMVVGEESPDEELDRLEAAVFTETVPILPGQIIEVAGLNDAVPPPPVQIDDPGTVFSTSPASPLINYTGPVPSTIDGVPQPPPPETPPSLVATDINGLPWDARIHAGSKNTIANGSWRIRKQPADLNKEQWDAYIEQVTNELKGAMAVPTPPPPAAGGTTIKTLAELTAAILAAGVLPVKTQEACAKVGLNGYPMLAARPDLIPQVAEELGLK